MRSKKSISKIRPQTDSIYNQILPVRVRKGDLMKIQIIEATIASIHKHGFEGFNYNAIGKEAGISRAHVAHYFPKKAEILKLALQVIAHRAQDLTIQKIRNSESPKDALYAMADAAIENLEEHPGYAATMLLCFLTSAADAKFREFFSMIRKMGVDRIEELLKTIPETKGLEPLRRQALAVEFQAVMTGHLMHHYTVNGGSVKALRKNLFRNMDLLLEGAK